MKKNLNFLMLSTLVLASCTKTLPSVSVSENSSSEITASDSNESMKESDSTLSTSSNHDSDLNSSDSDILSNSNSNESISSSSDEIIEPVEPVYHEKNITHFLGSDNDVYRININTINQEFPKDKENYVKGSLNITEQNTDLVLHSDMDMKIKLRGNSTMAADKKPFKIKFESKQKLFGLTKAKEWVLLANYYDKSNVRNYLAYLTANKLTHLDFQPSSIFVDVYFNNEYQGLYLLCEQMEANEGRVNIKDHSSSDGIGSFFLEADERAKDEYAGYQGYCYVTSGGYDFALKHPDCDDYLEALELSNSDDPAIREEATKTLNQYIKDVTWLQNFMDKTSESIYNLDHYEDYIDVDSFIDYYLVEEFFKNVDVGSTSQFYYIDQSADNVRLNCGPVWDFDIAAGAVDNSRGGYDLYTKTPLFTAYRDYYYRALFQDIHFINKVKARYSKIRESVFLSVFDELDLVKQLLDKAQTRNLAKWPYTSERKTWIEIYALGNYYYDIPTLSGHYDYLENFLENRLQLLDDVYL